MTKEETALSQAARAVDSAVKVAAQLTCHLMNQHDAVGEDLARRIKEDTQSARNLLVNGLGARFSTSIGARDRVPLELLDTPATRALLAALEAAAEAGAAVDRERGWIDDDGRAIGFGETYAGDALTLRMDIEGPSGSGLE